MPTSVYARNKWKCLHNPPSPVPSHRCLDVAGLSPEKPVCLHPPPASLSWPTLPFLALSAAVWVARSSGLETSLSPEGFHPHLRTGSLAFPSYYPPWEDPANAVAVSHHLHVTLRPILHLRYLLLWPKGEICTLFKRES